MKNGVEAFIWCAQEMTKLQVSMNVCFVRKINDVIGVNIIK